jgi:rRNA processing protein Gar1
LSEIGSFLHAVENEMLCSSLVSDKVPHFNAPIFLQNKSMIGKIDEILGPINEVYFSIKMGEGMFTLGPTNFFPLSVSCPSPKDRQVSGALSR